jgi:5-methyltetrahydropteroyltriglutamate--homocysteine methyltransferase
VPQTKAKTTVSRAENVGSLLRPAYLNEARDEMNAGRLSVAEYKKIEDRAADEAIALNERVGLDVITDGEQRRTFFFSTLTDIVEGLGHAGETPPAPMHWHGSEEYRSEDQTFSLPVAITGKLARRRSLAAEEFTYVRSRTDKPVKITLPSPLCLVALWREEFSREAYPDPMDVVADATRILREEVQELRELGCLDIQIDAPELGTLVDSGMREWYEADVHVSPERMLTEGVDHVNEIPKGFDGVRFGLHICRGNNAGRFLASGGYEAIAPDVFPRVDAYDYLMLEYDDDRQTVVLGIVSTKNPEMESESSLRARIDEAAELLSLDQLALSTQCGFASTFHGNNISPERQEEKLRLVADLAHKVWS